MNRRSEAFTIVISLGLSKVLGDLAVEMQHEPSNVDKNFYPYNQEPNVAGGVRRHKRWRLILVLFGLLGMLTGLIVGGIYIYLAMPCGFSE